LSPVSVLVVAGGAGKRFGGMKQFAALGGKPVLDWTLGAFDGHPEVDAIVLVLPDERGREAYEARFPKITSVVRGGERRQDSVRRGFAAVEPEEAGIVLVHDGARPFVGAALISRIVSATRSRKAAVPVLPLGDTVKEVREGRIVRTLDRSALFRAQTPQGFLYPLLRSMLEVAERDGSTVTDEAMLAEKMGIPVEAVEGDPRNIKITASQDLRIAEAMLDV
jgi:2-C-methyl-D-erythritol 4-phosphate cytidylyltransferase